MRFCGPTPKTATVITCFRGTNQRYGCYRWTNQQPGRYHVLAGGPRENEIGRSWYQIIRYSHLSDYNGLKSMRCRLDLYQSAMCAPCEKQKWHRRPKTWRNAFTMKQRLFGHLRLSFCIAVLGQSMSLLSHANKNTVHCNSSDCPLCDETHV